MGLAVKGSKHVVRKSRLHPRGPVKKLSLALTNIGGRNTTDGLDGNIFFHRSLYQLLHCHPIELVSGSP